MLNREINQMLEKYDLKTRNDKENAIKEIIQEIVLCGLSKAGFFKYAAFYGGTASRVFYDLNRFSEDLDFSLLEPNPDFKLEDYFGAIKNEVEAYGLSVSVSKNEKSHNTAIQSAFLKGNTKIHMLKFYDEDSAKSVIPNELIKIKIEIDTNPPLYAGYESKYRFLPRPYKLLIFDESSLFAGKLHAVICRIWVRREKGRDLYDYIFYISRGTKFNLKHLEERMIQSGFIQRNDTFDLEAVKKHLYKRFQTINYDSAKEDVFPFLNKRERENIDLWSADFFCQTLDYLQCDESI